jgi:hypothetical protein
MNGIGQSNVCSARNTGHPIKKLSADGNETIAEVLKSCCLRWQHEKLLRRHKFAAASQRRMRPFRQYAANLKPRIYRLRTKPLLAALAPMAGFDPFRAITGSSGPAFFRRLNR